jgi:WD40 repeat protein
MRAGVRTTVGRLSELTSKAAHPSVLALVCAGALAPVAALGGGAAAAALAGVFGGVGSGVLTDLVLKAVGRLRHDAEDEPEQDEIAPALAPLLDEMFSTGSEAAERLRTEITEILSEIDAARVAVEAAVESGDERISTLVIAGFASAAERHSEFEPLWIDTNSRVREVQRMLERQERRDIEVLNLTREQATSVQHLMRSSRVLVAGQRASETHQSPNPGSESPYLGLHPYQSTDADLFFGREDLTDRLITRVGTALTGSGILVITGASGAGKSSLLHAGLLPAIDDGALSAPGSAHWPRLVMTPRSNPLDEFAAGFERLTGRPAEELSERLKATPGEAGLLARRAVHAAGQGGTSARPIIVIDQFEEVFSLASPEVRDAFIAAIEAMVGTGQPQNALVIVGVRSDFIERCERYPVLREALEEARFPVPPMAENEMRKAITGPAAEAGLVVEAGIADAILEELRGANRDTNFEEASLPLLSQAMWRLWKKKVGNRLTLAEYEKLGGVANSVQKDAEEVYKRLEEEGTHPIAEQLFRRLITMTGDGKLARRKVPLSELEHLEGVTAVAQAFAEKRLLVYSPDAVEISHDVLLNCWSRPREWLKADAESLQLRGQLDTDAKEWDGRGNDASFLYRGSRLEKVESEQPFWGSNPHRFHSLDKTTRDFLEKSRRAEDRGTRIRRAVIGSLTGLLAVALTASVLAFVSQQDIADQRNRAISRDIASASLAAGETDGELARLLAATAWELSPIPEAESALLQSYDIAKDGLFDSANGTVSAIEFSPDGRYMASLTDGGIVTIWDAQTRERLQELPFDVWPASEDTAAAFAFSGDSRTLAVLGYEAIKLWDLEADELAFAPISMPATDITALAVNTDATLVAVANGTSYEVAVFDTATHARVSTIADTDNAFLEFHPTESILFFSRSNEDNADTELQSIDLESEKEEVVSIFDAGLEDLLYSPDGRWIANSMEHATVLEPVGDNEQESRTITGIQPPIVFLPDGDSVMGRAGDLAIGVWDIESQSQTASLPLGSCVELTCPHAIAPDGGFAVLADGPEITLLDPGFIEQSSVTATSWIATGFGAFEEGLLLNEGAGIVAANDRGVFKWDTESGAPGAAGSEPTQLSESLTTQLDLAPDGSMLASASGFTADVTVLDPSGAAEPVVLPTDGGVVNALAFSADGSRLAVAYQTGEALEIDVTGRIEIWDTETWELDREEPIDTGAHISVGLSFTEGRDSLVSNDFDSVEMIDLGSGEVIARHELDSVFSIDFVAALDSAIIETFGRLWRWDIHSDTLEVFLEPVVDDEILVGSNWALSPDGRFVASGDEYSLTVQLWDASTGELLQILPGFNVGNAMAFSADGESLAGFGEQVKVWDLSYLADPYTAVCGRIDRELTEAEWSEYIPDLDYGSVEACK